MSDLPKMLRRNHSDDYLRVYKDSCTCQYCRSAREIESLQGERDEARAWAAKYRCAVSPEQQETFPWENTGGEW